MDDRTGPGYIYLLHNQYDGWYKIGRTANPVARFRSWRWISRKPRFDLVPVLLIRVSNQQAAERFFQSVFNGKRTDGRHLGFGPRHEWFKLDRFDLKVFWRWASVLGESFYLHGQWAIPAEAIS